MSTITDDVRSVAESDDLSALKGEVVLSASDWFLSEDVEPLPTDEFEVNVAGPHRARKWIRFEIEAVPRDLLNEIRKDATDEDTGVEDEALANVMLAIQGLTNPNLGDPAQRGGYADPKDALHKKLGHKPLIIDAIARRIMRISGADPEDFRESTRKKDERPDGQTEVAAAGN